MSTALSLVGLQGIPLVDPGDDIAELLCEAMAENQVQPRDGDVVVIAQKIVSKAEDRYVNLKGVVAGEEATSLAAQVDKDPRLVELILRESREVLRHRPGVMIVEHRLGYVHANAGIDRSNLPNWDEQPIVLLLPENPDASAARIRSVLADRYGSDIAIIINDSAGRAWRVGTMGMAIGTAGLNPIRNEIGKRDLFGREFEVTEIAVADEIAAAASILMGQADEACPAVLVRGARWSPSAGGSSALLRSREKDLFR